MRTQLRLWQLLAIAAVPQSDMAPEGGSNGSTGTNKVTLRGDN